VETYFEIIESGNGIRVEALEFAYHDAEHEWDKNWLKSKVTVKAGRFSGTYSAEFMTIDFQKFKEDLAGLYDNLSGAAEFSGIEGYLTLKITGDGNGHLAMSVEANDSPGIYGNQLSFEMSFDQTYIKNIVNQLAQITQAFPVTGDIFNA
jgi:hypothetical protein